ncbi:MAG: hypothetical protein ACTSRS_22480 [Candidatus Helarchaeota archaeon]
METLLRKKSSFSKRKRKEPLKTIERFANFLYNRTIIIIHKSELKDVIAIFKKCMNKIDLKSEDFKLLRKLRKRTIKLAREAKNELHPDEKSLLISSVVPDAEKYSHYSVCKSSLLMSSKNKREFYKRFRKFLKKFGIVQVNKHDLPHVLQGFEFWSERRIFTQCQRKYFAELLERQVSANTIEFKGKIDDYHYHVKLLKRETLKLKNLEKAIQGRNDREKIHDDSMEKGNDFSENAFRDDKRQGMSIPPWEPEFARPSVVELYIEMETLKRTFPSSKFKKLLERGDLENEFEQFLEEHEIKKLDPNKLHLLVHLFDLNLNGALKKYHVMWLKYLSSDSKIIFPINDVKEMHEILVHQEYKWNNKIEEKKRPIILEPDDSFIQGHDEISKVRPTFSKYFLALKKLIDEKPRFIGVPRLSKNVEFNTLNLSQKTGFNTFEKASENKKLTKNERKSKEQALLEKKKKAITDLKSKKKELEHSIRIAKKDLPGYSRNNKLLKSVKTNPSINAEQSTSPFTFIIKNALIIAILLSSILSIVLKLTTINFDGILGFLTIVNASLFAMLAYLMVRGRILLKGIRFWLKYSPLILILLLVIINLSKPWSMGNLILGQQANLEFSELLNDDIKPILFIILGIYKLLPQALTPIFVLINALLMRRNSRIIKQSCYRNKLNLKKLSKAYHYNKFMLLQLFGVLILAWSIGIIAVTPHLSFLPEMGNQEEKTSTKEKRS